MPVDFLARKRLAVLGARRAGKSAVIISAVQGRFEQEYMPTFEDEYDYDTVVDGVSYRVAVVDSDGQDETAPYGLQYTIGVDGYVLMYSVVDRASFNLLGLLNDKLLDTLAVAVGTRGVKEVPRLVVGNKSDLGQRAVSSAEGAAFAEHLGVPYMETTALDPDSNRAIFDRLLVVIQRNLTDSHRDDGTDPALMPTPPPECGEGCSVQ